MSGLAFRNPAVQRLRALLGDRTARQEERRFVVEGRKSVREARRAGIPIDAVYVDPAAATKADRDEIEACATVGASVVELQPGVLARAVDTVSPQPIAAITSAVDISSDDLETRRPDFVVVCAEVRDPGNLGTILRASGAAGASAVICCEGSVDLYNPKAVRAAAGALFRVPVVARSDAKEVLDHVARWGLTRWGTAARGGLAYTEADLTRPFALVVGNEGHGLPPWIEAYLDGTLRIPMAPGFESLNVAGATTVVCFEAARQRTV